MVGLQFETMETLEATQRFHVLLLCGDCMNELNRSHPRTEKEISRNWTMIVMESGFVAGKCAAGCRSTFSDLNINTEFAIVPCIDCAKNVHQD
jgi:hypothetical protein